MTHSALAGDHDFVEVVFGEEEAVVAEAGEELFDVAVGVDALDGVRLGRLHLDGVRAGDVVAAEGGAWAGGFGVEDGEDISALVDAMLEVLDERQDELLRDVVESVPEEHDIELAAAEVEVLLEEAGDVEARFATIFFGRENPVASEGLVDEVGHVYAVAEAGEEVDVLRGGGTDVEDAEVRLLLEMLEHRAPSAGVAGDAGAGEQGTTCAMRFVRGSLKEVAQHACLNCP